MDTVPSADSAAVGPAAPHGVPWDAVERGFPGLRVVPGPQSSEAVAGDRYGERIVSLRWVTTATAATVGEIGRAALEAAPWADEVWICTADAMEGAAAAAGELSSEGLGLILIESGRISVLAEPIPHEPAAWYDLVIAAGHGTPLRLLAETLVREIDRGTPAEQEDIRTLFAWLSSPAGSGIGHDWIGRLRVADEKPMYTDRPPVEPPPPVRPFQVRLVNWGAPGDDVQGGPALLLPVPGSDDTLLLRLRRARPEGGFPHGVVPIEDTSAASLSSDSGVIVDGGWRRGSTAGLLEHSKYLGTLSFGDAAAVAQGLLAAIRTTGEC